MKNSSAKPPQREINRETALGLMAANMAVPGTGTFLSGRRIIGVIQTVAGMLGMAMTIALGMKMVVWTLSNWERLHDPYADPVEGLHEIWLASRWPLAGIAIFASTWLWAFSDSLRLVRKARSKERVPPPL